MGSLHPLGQEMARLSGPFVINTWLWQSQRAASLGAGGGFEIGGGGAGVRSSALPSSPPWPGLAPSPLPAAFPLLSPLSLPASPSPSPSPSCLLSILVHTSVSLSTSRTPSPSLSLLGSPCPFISPFLGILSHEVAGPEARTSKGDQSRVHPSKSRSAGSTPWQIITLPHGDRFLHPSAPGSHSLPDPMLERPLAVLVGQLLELGLREAAEKLSWPAFTGRVTLGRSLHRGSA